MTLIIVWQCKVPAKALFDCRHVSIRKANNPSASPSVRTAHFPYNCSNNIELGSSVMISAQ